ncbi:TetR family transcriptional regulator [Ralstonia solanacearum]|uniref:TetR family transcriptional regulator n=1 Tax=Ralstonia solanacearum species complex TaxID=3116862 RepID=UPI003BF7DADD
MRRTSEAKRDAILDVAAGLFREVGFERASMAEISARVGGLQGDPLQLLRLERSLVLRGVVPARAV